MEGELEGSRGGRAYVHDRDEIGNRATPLSGTQLIAQRVAAAEARVSLQHLRTGGPDSNERRRLESMRADFESATFVVANGLTTASSPIEVAAYIDKHATRLGLRLVVVDGAEFNDPRRQDFVPALKVLAVRHQFSVVFVATTMPLTTAPAGEGRGDELFQFEDVLDDVDLAVLIDRPDAREAESGRPGEADLHVVRHRYGPLRLLTVCFQGHWARFVEIAR